MSGKRLAKVAVVLLPVLFIAQACNVVFGDIFGAGNEGSGARGVFKSVDAGETWQAMSATTGDLKLSNAKVNRLFIERYNPINILAATLDGGVFASANEAKTWALLLPNFAAFEVFINPNNNQEIFASGASGKLAAIFKSENRGGAWVEIYRQPDGEADVSAMTFDPVNSSIIYAGLSTGTLIKTMDGGQTWKNVADFGERVKQLEIASSPARAIYAMLKTRGLKVSFDGGQSWTSLSVPDSPSVYNELALSPSNPELMYVATGGGLYQSFDGGRTWRRLLLPATPAKNNVSAAAVDPKNSRQIYAAIRYVFYRSDDGGLTWQTVSLPTRRLISDIVINPNEPNKIYVGLR